MPTHKVFISIILVFVITCTLATPLPDNLSSHESSSDEDVHSPLTPKQQLFLFTMRGFFNLTSFYVNSAANITEAILNDATLNENTVASVVVQEFEKNLTDFLHKYRTHKETEELFVLAELYSNTTSDYFETPEEQLTTDTKLIVNLLRKHGSEELDRQFRSSYDEFVKQFKEEFQKAKTSLESKFLDWFEQFKTITDLNSKTESFEKFILLY